MASLPVRDHAQQLVDAVTAHPVIVVMAETGSGKTTQLPQILMEAGLTKDGRIAVTQPRRVAAVSVARRVAEERGCGVGEEVGYAVRFEQRVSARTQVTYLTDGMLMQECLADAQLSKYSVIMLDEAHERILNTDILFGILKALVQTRKQQLRLVITSATLDGEKFSNFFRECPVLTISGRCFPVEVSHMLEKPDQPYLQLAIDKALDIHVYEPLGDILVFLTGQAEIEQAVASISTEIANIPDGESCPPAVIIPLYAALPPDQQARVFHPPPEGCRRIVIATNIAETSITVDGVVYVVDPGVVKQKGYDPQTGMESLTIVPISRVQATQRAGRAGRTRPGKCFRLYTRHTFDHEMLPETVPEILRTSLQAAVLHLKTLPLDVDVLHFDYMDPPKRDALEDALRQLYLLGAIDGDGRITGKGRQMAHLPLEPPLARMLVAAVELQCLPEALTIVAMLSAESIFQGSRGPEQIVRERQQEHSRGRHNSSTTAEGRAELDNMMLEGLGDHILLLRLFQGWQQARFSTAWCTDKGLSVRGMRFAKDVRGQLESMMSRIDITSRRPSPTDHGQAAKDASQPEEGSSKRNRDSKDLTDRKHHKEHKERKRKRHINKEGTLLPVVDRVRQAILAGSAPCLARRMDLHNGYRTLGPHATLAQLHPCTARIGADEDGLLPEWVVFQELVATARVFLSKVCPVEGDWVVEHVAKQRGVDVERLSGGAASVLNAAIAQAASTTGTAASMALPDSVRANQNALDAARARYAVRKAAKGK